MYLLKLFSNVIDIGITKNLLKFVISKNNLFLLGVIDMNNP